MIARVRQGVVPAERADGYGAYLADSDRGVLDDQRIPGHRGVVLLRRPAGNRVQFVLISLWESRASIAACAGADIDRAQYFRYDRECLIDPDPKVTHYEVVVPLESGGTDAS